MVVSCFYIWLSTLIICNTKEHYIYWGLFWRNSSTNGLCSMEFSEEFSLLGFQRGSNHQNCWMHSCWIDNWKGFFHFDNKTHFPNVKKPPQWAGGKKILWGGRSAMAAGSRLGRHGAVLVFGCWKICTFLLGLMLIMWILVGEKSGKNPTFFGVIPTQFVG